MNNLYRIAANSISITITRYTVEKTVVGSYDVIGTIKGITEECYYIKTDIGNFSIINKSKINKLDKCIMPDNRIIYGGFFEYPYTTIITSAFYEDKIIDVYESFKGDTIDYKTMRKVNEYE